MERIRKKLLNCGVIPILSIDDIEKGEKLGKALLNGGISVLEITLRTTNALKVINKITSTYPEILCGAGTVLTTEQVDRAIEAGASFIVSPGLSEIVAKHCINLNIPYIPCCVTGTEITRALELGFTTIKFFPAEQLGGISALKLLHGPFPNVSFIPTGGMSFETFESYLSCDCVLACGGQFASKSSLINENKWDEITNSCRKCIEINKKIRNK